MGVFETYRVAGGEAGMRHFLAQFGPCLAWPWSRLTDVPELDDTLIDRIAAQSDAQSGDRSIRELERCRDDNLIAILQALKAKDWGAGALLAEHERRIQAAGEGAMDD
jgi:carnitine 3-dehydrogenase